MNKILLCIFGVILLQFSLFISYFYYQSHRVAPVSKVPSPSGVTQKYVVSRVIDGDTLGIQGLTSPKGTARLIGIDTPEVGECFASSAASLLSQLVLHQEVKVEQDVNLLDQYGRALVHIYFLNADSQWQSLNAELLRRGAGRYYHDALNVKKGAEYLTAAYQGYANKAGLWSTCATSKSVGCTIKGNVGRDGVRYYHLPSFRHYEETVVNLDKGDQYFCSEKEALAAGWTRAVE